MRKFLALLLLLSFSGVGYAQTKSNPPPGMVLIPEGDFIMGSKTGKEDEQPALKIHLKAFYIDKNEVTNAEYEKFVKATGHRRTYLADDPKYNAPNQPVVGISWDDARDYAAWAGKRLPTEAEWEKAAKGINNTQFPWGNDWQENMANCSPLILKKPSAVGSYPKGASSYGVNDMAGNVCEWTSSWYHSHYYYRCPLENPIGPDKGDAKVIRGGSWIDSAKDVRASRRDCAHPNVRSHEIGFRCAKDLLFF